LYNNIVIFSKAKKDLLKSTQTSLRKAGNVCPQSLPFNRNFAEDIVEASHSLMDGNRTLVQSFEEEFSLGQGSLLKSFCR
jgi:hypothetical protein